MSEGMKCPVCGSDKFGTIKPLIAACDACQFRCGYSDLPRIATAMELARETVKHEAQSTGSLEDLREQLAEWSKAEKAVLKAWREE